MYSPPPSSICIMTKVSTESWTLNRLPSSSGRKMHSFSRTRKSAAFNKVLPNAHREGIFPLIEKCLNTHKRMLPTALLHLFLHLHFYLCLYLHLHLWDTRWSSPVCAFAAVAWIASKGKASHSHVILKLVRAKIQNRKPTQIFLVNLSSGARRVQILEIAAAQKTAAQKTAAQKSSCRMHKLQFFEKAPGAQAVALSEN